MIIITSNAKKDLSDPFLGRCNFHHIAFPDADMMRKIIGVHFSDLDSVLMEKAISAFYQMRTLDAVEKKPATRELINWIRALKAACSLSRGQANALQMARSRSTGPAWFVRGFRAPS